jgi:hypothetical protein
MKETTTMHATISRSCFGRLLLGGLIASAVTFGAVAAMPRVAEAVYNKRRQCERLWDKVEYFSEAANNAEQQWWNAPDGSDEEAWWAVEKENLWAEHEAARDAYLAADC